MKKNIPWIFLIFGIIFSTIIWGYISVPYDSSNSINGQYSLNKILPLNDTLRGLFFIFFPSSEFINLNKNVEKFN